MTVHSFNTQYSTEQF